MVTIIMSARNQKAYTANIGHMSRNNFAKIPVQTNIGCVQD